MKVELIFENDESPVKKNRYISANIKNNAPN